MQPNQQDRLGKILSLLVLISCLGGLISPAIARSFRRKDMQEINNINTLLERGKKQYRSGQFREAIATFQTASQFLEQTQKISERAESLLYLSWSYQELGEYEEAESIILQNIEILQERSPAIISAMVRNTLAQLQMNRGQLDRALKNWEIAEQLYQQANDRLGQLGSQINQAQVLEEQGRYRLACDRILQAFAVKNTRCKAIDTETFASVLQAIAKEPDPLLKGLGWRSLGVSLQALGSLRQSREAISVSLDVLQTLDRPVEIARTLFILGNTERLLGERETALQRYREAVKIAIDENTPEARIVAMESLANQLSLSIESERFLEAESLLSEIRKSIAFLPVSETAIYAQLNILRSWLKLRQKQKNSPDYTEIAQLLATLHQQANNMNNTRAESQILGILGSLYSQQNYLEEAIALTNKAIDLSVSLEREFLFQWRGQLAHLLERQGKIDEAIAAYREAITTFEEFRSDLVGLNPKIRYNFRDRVEPIYRNYISLQLNKIPEQKTQQNESSKRRLQDVKAAIESLRVAELEDYLQEVCVHHQSLEESETNLAVIYTIILGERMEILVSFPKKNLQHYKIDKSSDEIKQLAVQLRQSFSPIFSVKRHLLYSQELYKQIIQPIENELKTNDISTLAFVLDGVLQNIPMGAFHDGNQYLLEKYELVLIPGLQLLTERSPTQLELKAIAAGLSEARESFTPLPAVVEEVAEIERQLSSEVLLNEYFTAANLRKALDDRKFPILHLATHGQFSSQLEDTFLLLWDGPLDSISFANLLWERESGNVTPIELLVLSACQTAKGDDRAALGLAGIAVRSGARSTLASLWSVNDRSTSELMAEFYRFLGEFRGDRAKALQQAQLSLLNDSDYAHPYYWAPFILAGYWR
ncbi:MAG: CHAT domain-containing protein [Cyanobacteria bacterium SBLK]|nr:CHAT domain-containing protein [Cyanobacteria bacterium SBLK]